MPLIRPLGIITGPIQPVLNLPEDLAERLIGTRDKTQNLLVAQ